MYKVSQKLASYVQSFPKTSTPPNFSTNFTPKFPTPKFGANFVGQTSPTNLPECCHMQTFPIFCTKIRAEIRPNFGIPNIAPKFGYTELRGNVWLNQLCSKVSPKLHPEVCFKRSLPQTLPQNLTEFLMCKD